MAGERDPRVTDVQVAWRVPVYGFSAPSRALHRFRTVVGRVDCAHPVASVRPMAPASPPSGFRIIVDDLEGAEIQHLLRLHAAGMLVNSPKDACHFLDLTGLQRPDVTVWSLWDGGDLAGCGALREIEPDHGEVKSMRTAPDHLGRGVGRALLAHIVSTAEQRSYRRLSLETGTGDAFAAAIHLYESVGFRRGGPFADYVDNEFSQFFTLDL
jgi:putative acetyltransferase